MAGEPARAPLLSPRLDYHRVSVRLCRFGLNACAVGAAASAFQDVLNVVAGEGGRQEEPTAAPRRTAG